MTQLVSSLEEVVLSPVVLREAEAVEKWPKFKENAQADDDFASLREDARFTELVA